MQENTKSDVVKGAKAAAAVTGLNEREIYYLVQTEGVPYRRVGRSLFFSRDTLLSALRPEQE